MAVYTRPAATTTASTYTAAQKAALGDYHKECFLIHGVIVDFDGDEEYGTAYSKHRRESSDFRKITVGTAHGQYYTLVIFSNQEDDIADLIGEPVGSRIAVMAREIDYGRRYDGCLRVTSVIDLEEFDKVRHELASSRLVAKSLVMGITKDQMIERLVRNMINSSSHGWKLDQTPTSRAIPL